MSESKELTGYRFLQKDPVVDVYRFAKKKAGLTEKQIHERGGPPAATTRRWDYGQTKKPQHLTLVFAMRACGFDEQWVDAHGATIMNGYRKEPAKPTRRPRKHKKKK